MTAPLDSQVRELAAAIREALNVPVAAAVADPEAAIAERMLRERRGSIVRGCLKGLAEGRVSATLTGAAQTIREMTAESPVTYTPYEPDPKGGAK